MLLANGPRVWLSALDKLAGIPTRSGCSRVPSQADFVPGAVRDAGPASQVDNLADTLVSDTPAVVVIIGANGCLVCPS